MKNTDIAIVGMSCCFPGAENIDDFWNNLINGIDSTSEVPENRIDSAYFDQKSGSNHFYCKKGGFISTVSLDTEFLGITPSEAKKMDPSYLLALKLIYQALEDAQVFTKNIDLKKGSLIVGKENYIGTHDLHVTHSVQIGEQVTEVLKNILPGLSPEDIDKVKKTFQQDNKAVEITPNQISTIANKLNMEGASYTLDASSSSSLVALEQSIQELISERSDIAITGGIQFSQNSPFWSVFTQKQLLSRKQKMSPFSQEADGILLGEGAGFIVLKKLEKALHDNDKIYAVIKGVGISNDGVETTREGQKKAISNALKKAGVQSSEIGYIETNGVATKNGDKTEIDALSDIFKEDTTSHKVLIGSVKSNIGHTLSASGIAGLIKTALSLYYRQIPSTLNCSTPIEQVKTGKFAPVQKTTDWDQNTIPLTAGISSFSFGGVNAHAIIQAYGEKVEPIVSFGEKEKIIAITASTKEELLDALDKRNFSISDSEGNYRLILFDPTPDRIEKAKKLISKDKSWKGRQDIWFSNKPLLKNGGKVAFLFPGFDPGSDPEVKSISDYFGYPLPEEITDSGNIMLDHSFKQLYGGEIIDAALKKSGVIPDMNAGHSLGEWFAAKAGGLFSEETVKKLLKSMDPEKYQLSDVYFIAAGCGFEKIAPWIDEIPDLYLSNDNCPNQVLLCGTATARDSIIKKLKTEQVFHQVLTFQSGFHSPFIKEKLNLLDEALEHIEIQKNNIPIWSATTLDLYPHDFKSFKELTIQHLIQPVLFRELIEKLYKQENAKVFIQVGSGSLVGFVDDTLKNEDYAAISAFVANRTTLEQLKRVLALLFIEGKKIDLSFLGIKENQTVSSELIEIPMDSDVLIKDFSSLQELTKKYTTQQVNVNSFDSLFIKSNHPVIQAMNENLKEMIAMQSEFVELAQQKNRVVRSHPQGINTSAAQSQTEVQTLKPEPVQTVPSVPAQKTGTTFEEPLYIDIKEHPYLIDHSLTKQPEHWENLEDIGPVIPMTMTFELLTEAAHKQDLSQKVLQLGPVSVFQWMKVHTPFEQTIIGNWKNEHTLAVAIKNFATAEVTLGNSYPEAPAAYTQEIDLGENIVSDIPTPEQIYRHHMFHGPSYQGIIEVQEVTKKGLRGLIKKSAGKGSLLDTIGQLYGLFLQLTLDNAKVSFPVKVDEINFYQDMQDQDGIFEFICISTSITEFFAVADIIIKRDGKIWCIIKNWKNQRFGFDDLLWKLTMAPAEHILAKEIAPNVYFFNNAYDKAVSWEFLMKIYLNQEEKRHYESLALNKRKDYLISRIALKDGVRSFVQKHFNKKYFPIEFNIEYDANGKPSISGVEETKGLEISLAHKGTDSVSITSDKPAGIDIELIEEREKGFMELTFTEKELSLLKDRDLAEWSTRFWVAKEAYGKMLGVGLKGNPKQYEVKEIQDEHIIIENTTINTIKFNNYIIGWTL